jgi:hypothetical protein
MLNHMIEGPGRYVNTITRERAQTWYRVRIDIPMHLVPIPATAQDNALNLPLILTSTLPLLNHKCECARLYHSSRVLVFIWRDWLFMNVPTKSIHGKWLLIS